MSSLVSVIIPTYNRAALVRRAIDSVIAQSHQAFEVIVVNDGSTDGTGAMLKSCYGSVPSVRVVEQSNGGVCAARNRGLDEAQGAFIAFLDSDDVWLPWKLEVQVACLTNRPEAGMVWTDMEAIGPDGATLRGRHLRVMYDNYRDFPNDALFEGTESLRDIMTVCPGGMADVQVCWGRIQGPMILGNLVHTSTVMLTRDRLRQTGRFDESLAPAGEDHDFHLRTCEAGPVGLIDVPSIRYQTGHPDQLTRHRAIMARNYLLTMERALVRARPDAWPAARMVRRARAAGNAWLASALLECNDRSAARGAIIRSLRNLPVQPRLFAELALSFLPSAMDGKLRSLSRDIVTGSARFASPPRD